MITAGKWLKTLLLYTHNNRRGLMCVRGKLTTPSYYSMYRDCGISSTYPVGTALTYPPRQPPTGISGADLPRRNQHHSFPPGRVSVVITSRCCSTTFSTVFHESILAAASAFKPPGPLIGAPSPPAASSLVRSHASA